MKNTAVRLTTEHLKELARIGARDDRSVAYLIRKSIDEFIARDRAEKHEDRRK